MSEWLAIGKKQSDLFMSNNVGYMDLLVTADCPRSIMNTCYNILVRIKKISPIEKLDPSEKINLWESAKEFAKGRMNNDGLTELSKALIALEYFLNFIS